MTVVNLAQSIRPRNPENVSLDWESFAQKGDKRFWKTIFEQKDLTIDMDGVSYVAPGGLIWLYFILLKRARLWARPGNELNNFVTKLRLPRNLKTVSYLRKLGFETKTYILSTRVENESLFSLATDYQKNHPINEHIGEIRYVNHSEWRKNQLLVLDDVKNYLAYIYNIPARTDLEDEQIVPFSKTLKEITANITIHGGHEKGTGTGFISFVPKTSTQSTLRFSFMDVGMGFLATIKPKVKRNVSNHSEAILESLLFRFFNPEDQVEGLFPTMNFVRQKNGVIKIRSGDALVVLDLGVAKNQKIFDARYPKAPTIEWLNSMVSKSTVTGIPGAHICVDLEPGL